MMEFKKQFALGIIFFIGLANQSLAQVESLSSKKHFEAFPVDTSTPFRIAAKIDWTQETVQSKKALTYKAAIEEAVTKFKARGDGGIIANKFLVITIGCGTQCTGIGLYDLQTGIPVFLEATAAIDISYEASSRLLVLDPKEVIEKIYSVVVPPWLKTRYYLISDAGVAVEWNPKP